MIENMKHWLAWRVAKAGFWLVGWWIRLQYEVDGDLIQVEEILADVAEEKTGIPGWGLTVVRDIGLVVRGESNARR